MPLPAWGRTHPPAAVSALRGWWKKCLLVAMFKNSAAKQQDLARLIETGLVAVIRAESGERLCEVAEALIAGGVLAIEITFTVPNAADAIRQVAAQVGDRAIVGAGTVTTVEMAKAAVEAGARFLVSPVVDLEVIAAAQDVNCLIMPGAMTPTEVLTAWQAGADIVKIFPADVAGPGYLKALNGPLPEVRLMPTGGVNLETAAEFLRAGACALGVGGALVSPKDIAAGDYEGIRARAKKFREIVDAFRAESQSVSH